MFCYELPKRKQQRLEEFDYSQNGTYFVTICTRDRTCIFWNNRDYGQYDVVGADIIRPQEQLNNYGLIVKNAIEQTPKYYPNISIDKYVVMPNHIHILMQIQDCELNGRIISAPTISIIIGQMKRWVSKQIGYPIWQKSFYDHIIRNQSDYDRIWRYIDENPIKWELDEYYVK